MDLRTLTLAIEQSPAAVIITDVDGRIEYVNRRFSEMTGYAADEVLGQTPRVLRSGFNPPDEYTRLWETILRGDVWRGEFCNRRKDGGHYWHSASISPVRDDDGRVTRFVAIQEDITEQKQTLEALQWSESQLQQAQKMEAVGRLAGGVVHDFNNVLGAILGFAAVVRGNLPADDPSQAEIEEIRKAAHRASAIVRQLLAVSRQQVLAPRVLDLNEMLADMHSLVARLIGESLSLELLLSPQPMTVLADPVQIERVILNLVINSRDAMPHGGPLVIETGHLQVEADGVAPGTTLPPGDYIQLAVRDAGLGMSEAVRVRAFEPFFTTKVEGHGTGLGLSTVYGIVTQSGGGVSIESALGRGTTVRVFLPLVDASLFVG